MLPDIFGMLIAFSVTGAAYLLITGLDPMNYATEIEEPRQRSEFSLFHSTGTLPRHAAVSPANVDDSGVINEVIRKF